MADDSELSRLDPEPKLVTLQDGQAVEVVRMRTRQFFRLLKILTHGAGPAVMQAGLDFSAEPEVFARSLMALVVMSIPDAESEAIQFIQSMCQPHGLSGKTKPNKQQEEHDSAIWEKFNKALFNPELEDTLDLVSLIVESEAPELQALGKKAAVLLKVAGLAKDEKTEEVPGPQELAENLTSSSAESSLPPSISSATSTGGQTSTSTTSRSAGSGRQSKRPRAAASATG